MNNLSNISIVILSHNRKKDLAENLKILLKNQSTYGYEIIVVDNASTDGAIELLRHFSKNYPKLKVVYNKENLGVAGGRNVAYRIAKGEIIISLDDDSSISINMVRKVSKKFQLHSEAGILAFKIKHKVTNKLQNNHGELEVEVANFHGAGEAYLMEVFRSVGFLDEECTFGGEELDMSIRIHSAGFKTIYVPDIIVEHNNFLRKGKVGKHRRFMRVYNFTRIFYKHFPRNVAFIFSIRFLISHIMSGFGHYEISFFAKIIFKAINGRKSGIKQHQLVPIKTIQFYKNPKLKPDHGNIPLINKLYNRILNKDEKNLFNRVL